MNPYVQIPGFLPGTSSLKKIASRFSRNHPINACEPFASTASFAP